ncbi:MAG: hypothetical protein M9924_07800 [Rhizobiaceae bacterium]|nr:hypothetical protein [Rhizobiaceae bacterium]
MQIDNAEEFEDLTATTMRLRDVLDDLCSQPLPTKEAAIEVGQRQRLLGSAIMDTGQALESGVFVLRN